MRVQAAKIFVWIEEARSTGWILKVAQSVEPIQVQPKLAMTADVNEFAPPPKPLTREFVKVLKFKGNLTYRHVPAERVWNIVLSDIDLIVITNAKSNV